MDIECLSQTIKRMTGDNSYAIGCRLHDLIFDEIGSGCKDCRCRCGEYTVRDNRIGIE